MRRNAFTLVEVLVALGLVVALAAGMYGFVTSMRERQERIAEETRRSGGVSAFFDQLESDVLTCVAQDGKLGTGVRGNAESLTLVSRGVGISSDAALADARVTEYRFAGDTISASRREAAGTALDQPFSGGIGKVRFRYYDGTTWRDSFDSVQASGLPVAIEVAVWFAGPEPAVKDAPVPARESAEGSGPTDFGPAESFEPEPLEDPADEATRAADRVRLIVVPDGPVAGWKASEG